MQNYIKTALNYNLTIITVGLLIIFYINEITLTSLILYIFALVGFVITMGLLVLGFGAYMTRDITKENEQLKSDIKKLQASSITFNENDIQKLKEWNLKLDESNKKLDESNKEIKEEIEKIGGSTNSELDNFQTMMLNEKVD